MTAELKKGLRHAELIVVEQVAPDIEDDAFGVGGRWDPQSLGRVCAACGFEIAEQRRVIDFAGRIQRKGFDKCQGRRLHVTREQALDSVRHSRLRCWCAGAERQQQLSGRVTGMHHHATGRHARLCRDHRFDLTGFDPNAPYFDLMIDTPDKFDRAIGTHAAAVTSAIQRRKPVIAGRVRDEDRRREFGTVQVAQGEP